MKPFFARSSVPSATSVTLGGIRRPSTAGTLSAAWLVAASLTACGDVSSNSGMAMSDSALHSSAATAEASIPLAMPAPSEGPVSETGQPIAAAEPGTQSAGQRETERAKDTPPPRTERQAGDISDPSPSGFRLGSINVVIDGSTRIEPVTALAEGEPVDVTGHFESDRRTLRATVVRSTRPAAEPANSGTAEAAAASAG